MQQNKQPNRQIFLSLFFLVVTIGLLSSMSINAQQPLTQPNRPKQEINQKPGAAGNPDNKMRPMFDTFIRNPYEAKLLAAALGLTEDQQTRIRDVYRQYGPSMVNLLRDMRQKRLALDDALFNDEYNEGLVNQRAKEFVDAQSQVVLLQTKIQAQIRQILTTDQLHKFIDLRQEETPRKVDRELQRGLRQQAP